MAAQSPSPRALLTSMLKEVFAMHRQLDHENAAKGVIIRWNGPELDDSDALIKPCRSGENMNYEL